MPTGSLPNSPFLGRYRRFEKSSATASALFVVTGFLLWTRWRNGAWRHIDIFGAANRRIAPAPTFPPVGVVPVEPSALTGVSDV